MRTDEIALTEKRLRLFLSDKYRGFFKMIPFLKNGYSFLSLEKILQADVPVIVAEASMTEEEIGLLREIRKNVCLISVNEAWKTLADHHLIPDFVLGDPNGFAPCLDQAFMIVNVQEENAVLKKHQGKQFFYWTENVLTQYLYESAKKGFNEPYQQNQMNRVPETETMYEAAAWMADFMGASCVVFFGSGNCLDAEWLRECCRIECHIGDIVDELYPLFDKKGWESWKDSVAALEQEAKGRAYDAGQIIRLYARLFQMACQETVYQEEFENVMREISECMEKFSQGEIAPYILKVANEREEFQTAQAGIPYINDIAQAAMDGAWQFQKIMLTCEYFATSLNETDFEQIKMRKTRRGLRKRKSILLMVGDSRYNVLPHFLQGLKRGFQKLGFDVYTDSRLMLGPEGYSVYQNTVGFDYVLAINGVTITIKKRETETGDGRFWYENGHTKAGAIFVDHPRRHADRIECSGKDIDLFFPDKYWCRYVRQYMLKRKNPYYLPMGGADQDDGAVFEEKENKVVFFGSGRDLDDFAREINESPLKPVLWRIIEELTVHPQYTVEDMIMELGRQQNCQDAMATLMLHDVALITVETYIRNYFRYKVVMEIAKSGIPFDIYGWRNEEGERYQNVSLKEQVDFDEMLRICRHARFVLNINPWTKDGVQERVFNAMLGGSVAVTDTSELLEREFRDGENIVLYRLDEIEKLPERIKYYMDHPDEAKKIAENGYRIAKERHTWEMRAKEMMELWK